MSNGEGEAGLGMMKSNLPCMSPEILLKPIEEFGAHIVHQSYPTLGQSGWAIILPHQSQVTGCFRKGVFPEQHLP